MTPLDSTTHTLQLDPNDFGFESWTHANAETLSAEVGDANSPIKDITSSLLKGGTMGKESVDQGVINLHEARKQFSELELEVINTSGTVDLVLHNIPNELLRPHAMHKELILSSRTEKKIIQALRDISCPLENNERLTPVERSKAMMKRADLLDGEWSPRTAVWGGHSIKPEAYNHTKDISYADVVINETIFSTGAGNGVMRAPFAGAARAYAENGKTNNPRMIGLAEPKILARENPNGYVNELVILKNIYERMIAFIASSNRLRADEGSTGTMQEIFTALSVLLHEKNQDIPYMMDLVGRKKSPYMQTIKDYFETIFKSRDRLDGILKFHLDAEPRSFGEYVMESNKSLPKNIFWQDDMYFPEEVLYPQQNIGFDSIENIDLSRNQSESELIKQIERFFDSIVYLTIKNPEVAKGWGNDRPLVKGDADIIRATNSLYDQFLREGRIATVKGLKDQKLIRFD